MIDNIDNSPSSKEIDIIKLIIRVNDSNTFENDLWSPPGDLQRK